MLENLKPERVFYYFEEICRIPHGSYNIQKISDYLVEFAKTHELKVRQEECGNVIIWKEASAGYEDAPGVILQGHMDMVAVKDKDCTLDMEKDGLELEVNGDLISAKGTSLGGDDGIAVAYALAILESDTIPHPALEAVFTVNEEVGMLGADALDASDLKGKILMNMDSEDEGIFLSSCAGGATVECKLPLQRVPVTGLLYHLCIEGVAGGHSGTGIIKESANANVLMGRMLYMTMAEAPYYILKINGGEKDNAIATFCDCEIVIDKEQEQEFLEAFRKNADALKKEYILTDPNMKITAGRLLEGTVSAMHPSSGSRVVLALTLLPYGVQRRDPGLKDMVETSLNLGILTTEDTCVSFCYAVRSSVEDEKKWLIEKMEAVTILLGGDVDVSGEYPGWKYSPDSRVRDIMCQVYEEQTGKKAQVCGIHAGVECGLLSAKLEDLDCISYGPQMQDIHTTSEVLSIASVTRTWELTLEVLKRLK